MMRSSRFAALLILFTSLTACGSGGTTSTSSSGGSGGSATPPPAPSGPQGLYGTFRVIVGNQMPGTRDFGEDDLALQTKIDTNPAGRTIHLLRAPAVPRETLDKTSADYVASTTTARDGTFSFQVPPGDYSAVVELDGRLYRNGYRSSGGKTSWSSTTVKASAWTYEVLEDTRGASY